MITKLSQIETLLTGKPMKNIVIVAAHDDNVLSSVKEVYDKGYAKPILIGDKMKIFELADAIGLDLSETSIIHELDDVRGARMATEMVHRGEAQVVMKGLLPTADLMRAVLNKDTGLRTKSLISNAVIVENPNYPKLIFIADAAINIEPDLMQKADIIRNTVEVIHRLGIDNPKVAVLSSIEVVNTSIQSTMDGALLMHMGRRGQIGGCIIDGPLSLDLAISPEAVRHKKVVSEVAGDADLLLAPNLDVANVLVKSLTFLQNCVSCPFIAGTKAPVVITSRADTADTKYYSILMALAMC